MSLTFRPAFRPDGSDVNESNDLKASASARTPFVGETVLVDLGNEQHNGASLFPAIVVRVWGTGAGGTVPGVNVRVLHDADRCPLWKSSLAHKSLMSPPTSFNQPRPCYFIFLGEDPIP